MRKWLSFILMPGARDKRDEPRKTLCPKAGAYSPKETAPPCRGKTAARMPCFLLAFSLILACALPLGAKADGFEASSPRAMLLDLKTGKVLYEKNADEQVYPASTTKIMTAILALEHGDLDQTVAASAMAVNSITPGHTNMGIRAGEELTVRQLLYGLLLYSAGDAANVLAENTAGSIDAFVNGMNQKAQELGMAKTHYANTHGEHDSNHYTTARDMSKLALYAMNFPDFREIVKTAMYTIAPTDKYKETRYLSNTNLLLSKHRNAGYFYANATGIKTGFTSEAKSCLVASAAKGDMEFLALVFGAESANGKVMSFVDATAMFEYAFSNYTMLGIVRKGELITQAPLKSARKASAVLLEAGGDLSFLKHAQAENGKITWETTLDEKIKAPVSKGDILGSARYFVDGEPVGTVDLIADKDYKFDPIAFVFQGIIAVITSPWFYLPLVLLFAGLAALRQHHYNQRRKRRLERQSLQVDRYKSAKK